MEMDPEGPPAPLTEEDKMRYELADIQLKMNQNTDEVRPFS